MKTNCRIEKEIFVDLYGYEGLYKISNYGRLYSLYKNRILGTHYDRYGYEIGMVYKNGKQYHYKIHRMVALSFLSNPYNLPEVNHIDGDKTNNHLYNLEFSSKEYNLKDSWNRRRNKCK